MSKDYFKIPEYHRIQGSCIKIFLNKGSIVITVLKEVSKVMVFVASKHLVFSSLHGAVLRAPSETKAPALMSRYLQHSAFLQQSKVTLSNITLQQSLKKYHFQDLRSFDITLKACKKGKNIYPKVTICHCHKIQNKN